MKNRTKKLNFWLGTAIVLGCGVLLANQAQAQTEAAIQAQNTIYRINDGTNVFTNLVNVGTTRPTLTNNLNGTFTLANGIDSGDDNAVSIDSSDQGSTLENILGRPINPCNVITVSGTVASANLDYSTDGVEFGLNIGTGFRLLPNVLLQIDADEERGGFAPFYGTPRPGLDIDRTQTPGVTEASLNDGYTFSAKYSANNIVYTVSDIVTTNEIGNEPVGATTFTYSLQNAVAADPSLQGVLDNYIAQFGRIVGGSSAYFSHQKTGTGNTSTTFSNFGVTILLLGDVDLSGAVDFADVAPFIRLLASGAFQAEADVDQNDVVNFDDINLFIRILAFGCV